MTSRSAVNVSQSAISLEIVCGHCITIRLQIAKQLLLRQADVMQPKLRVVYKASRRIKRAAAYGNDSHVFFSSFVDGFLPLSLLPVPFLLATRFSSGPSLSSSRFRKLPSEREAPSSTILDSYPRKGSNEERTDGRKLDLSRMHRRHRRRWCRRSELHPIPIKGSSLTGRGRVQKVA